MIRLSHLRVIRRIRIGKGVRRVMGSSSRRLSKCIILLSMVKVVMVGIKEIAQGIYRKILICNLHCKVVKWLGTNKNNKAHRTEGTETLVPT